jgi:hypothetical protein
MMNETGRYPGQAWLWPHTFWYQIPPFTTSHNADAQTWALMMVLRIGHRSPATAPPSPSTNDGRRQRPQTDPTAGDAQSTHAVAKRDSTTPHRTRDHVVVG